MTVKDLIEALENEHPDAEVRLMTQQSYPFENAVQRDLFVPAAEGVCHECGYPKDDAIHGDKEQEHEFDEDWRPAGSRPFEDRDPDDDSPMPVYIVEGGQMGYGDAKAWNG